MQHVSEGAVGLLVGTFDLFHVGHLDAARHAAAGFDRLVVGVVSDELAERVTGRRPYVPETERREIVAALRGVSAVVLLHDADPRAAAAMANDVGAGVLLPVPDDAVADRLAGDLRAAADGPAIAALPPVRATASAAVRAALGRAAGTDGRTSVA